MALRSGEFSLLALCLAVTHWKKLAVLGIAALVGTGYYIGKESATPAPAPAAVTANESQTLFNLRGQDRQRHRLHDKSRAGKNHHHAVTRVTPAKAGSAISQNSGGCLLSTAITRADAFQTRVFAGLQADQSLGAGDFVGVGVGVGKAASQAFCQRSMHS